MEAESDSDCDLLSMQLALRPELAERASAKAIVPASPENAIVAVWKSLVTWLARDEDAPDGDELQCLKEGEQLASKADQSLRQMEMEVKTLPAEQRAALNPELQRYRSNLLERRKVLKDTKDNASRKTLLGGDGTTYGKSLRDRDKALTVTEQMERDNHRLEEARRNCLETEQVGVDVLSDLRAQREVIQRTKDNVREVGSHYGTARRMLEGMLFRAKMNKYLTCAALLFLLIFTGVAAYMFLGSSSSNNSGSTEISIESTTPAPQDADESR